MTTSLLICDDSTVARKQVARSLPIGWDVDITFATHGVEAISAIKEGKGDILLLDLNMPVMDGYQVLEAIVKEDLPTLTIVISGDIQPEAYKRVTALGALAFIKKPIDKDKLASVLQSYGICSKNDILTQEVAQEVAQEVDELSLNNATQRSAKEINIAEVTNPKVAVSSTSESSQHRESSAPLINSKLIDCYQEIANVAMGQAGDLLARLLGVFVVLPIPNVNFIEVSELIMALSDVEDKDTTSGICQGFIGAGISGEALLILNDSSFKDIASLMKYEDSFNDSPNNTFDKTVELELLMDMANTLIGACLNGISSQLDMSFSQGHPVVLGQHRKISELIDTNTEKWKKTLAIEISYGIENYAIKCDLLLLFTEASVATFNNKIAYLLD
ncbi:MAG: chemotaxis protein CheY-P-specific phosphatase CheC/DNA-binding response OmpR family regulator [Colwellia sp.]|jgi:chemotaxis protein CheY-P-specific phosphatase CheC/DNA-binding response OmpR family regulator|tara:strand:- start:19699 stop:20865 length:1167 start_codon:yes stop_codon:yes gene_type:complete